MLPLPSVYVLWKLVFVGILPGHPICSGVVARLLFQRLPACTEYLGAVSAPEDLWGQGCCNSLWVYFWLRFLDHQDVTVILFEVKIDNSSVEVDMDARMGQACRCVWWWDFSAKFTIKALSGSNLPHDFCLLGDSAAIPGVSRPSMQYAHRSSQLLCDAGGLGRDTSEELEFTTPVL